LTARILLDDGGDYAGAGNLEPRRAADGKPPAAQEREK